MRLGLRYRILWSIAAVVIVLDQLTKWWAVTSIPQYRPITVIAGFFDLVNIRNRGAAFGFLNRSDIEWQFWLFLAATLIAAWAIVSLVRSARHDPLLFAALGCVMGGAVGNLIDRVRFRAVVDFLDFYVGIWHWPAFNVADIAICVGAFGACLAMYRAPREQTFGVGKEKKS
ncbi:MAG: signal peptidase II [Desulfovibrionaceae bacterium]